MSLPAHRTELCWRRIVVRAAGHPLSFAARRAAARGARCARAWEWPAQRAPLCEHPISLSPRRGQRREAGRHQPGQPLVSGDAWVRDLNSCVTESDRTVPLSSLLTTPTPTPTTRYHPGGDAVTSRLLLAVTRARAHTQPIQGAHSILSTTVLP